MTGELIELQVSAVRNACGQMTAGAALEMEEHLRVLRYMGRLANCAAHRASA